MVTSGGQIVASTRELRAVGAIVTTALAVLDRGEGGAETLRAAGIELRSLLARDDLASASPSIRDFVWRAGRDPAPGGSYHAGVFPLLRNFSLVSAAALFVAAGALLLIFLSVEVGEREALEGMASVEEIGEHVGTSMRVVAAALVVLFGGLYVALFLVVAHGDRALRAQFADLETEIAGRKRAQTELAAAESLAALGRVMPAISHELRNPLGAMRSAIFLVRNHLRPDQEDAARAVGSLDRCVTRCDRILDRLTTFTKVGDLHPHVTVLDSWLKEILDAQQLGAGIRLEQQLGVGALAIAFDAEHLRRAVEGVVENGLQAAADSLRTGRASANVRVATRARSDRVEIEVVDDGPGIPPDVMPRIFEPMFSTRGFGVGLGLTVVQRVMQQHNGGIDVRSVPERGTEVTLWLPLATPAVSGAA